MNAFRNWVIRILAFVRKEIVELLRQPRLVVTLILGPFAILALFGAGYRQQTEPLATLFVASGESRFVSELEARVEELGDGIDYLGTLTDRSEAERQVRDGFADVAVVVPDDPIETVRNGERAVFTVLHDKLDPFEAATISLITRTTVDGVNRRILQELVAAGQAESADLERLLPAARETSTLLRRALEAGDTDDARRYRQELVGQLQVIERQAASTEVLVDNIRDELDGEPAPHDIAAGIAELEQRVGGLDVSSLAGPLDEEISSARRVESDVAALEQTFIEFRQVPPDILVSPFGASSEVVGSTELDITDFYAPGVIALLLQHLAITFAGLSLVRERDLGTSEVFRVAPIGSTHLLVGKYLGYLAASAVVAGALSGLMLVVFDVPMLGSPWSYGAVVALLVLASLGIGFVISSLVNSDTQAVNLSLIVLLLSIFFSGFFLSLERLAPSVRTVSWALPITHAVDSLRDVMFRGGGVDLRTWIALGGGSAALFLAALALVSWRLRAE